MISMPKQVEYALMVLGEMHGGAPGQLFQARALCKELGIPFEVASKVMQRMNHAGILRSIQGKYGGYQLIRSLENLSLEELMDVVIGHKNVAACLEVDHVCQHAGKCTIRRAVQRLDDRLHGLLGEISLLELIGQ
jgi:Rrf2 family protein